MLPQSHIQAYQEFLTVLLTLRDHVTAEPPNAAALQETLARAQQIFQQIMNLPDESLAPEVAARWQSVQTEVYRALRLLNTDILFLRSSKGAATSERRLTAVGDRLEQIIGYCQVILQ